MFLPDSSKPIFLLKQVSQNNELLFEGLFGRKQTTLNIQTPPKNVFGRQKTYQKHLRRSQNICGNLVCCFGLITWSNLSLGNLWAWLKQDNYTPKKLMAGSQKFVVWAGVSPRFPKEIFSVSSRQFWWGVRFKLFFLFYHSLSKHAKSTRLQQPLRPVSSLGCSSWRVILILLLLLMMIMIITMMTVVMICDDDFNDDGVDPYH